MHETPEYRPYLAAWNIVRDANHNVVYLLFLGPTFLGTENITHGCHEKRSAQAEQSRFTSPDYNIWPIFGEGGEGGSVKSYA